MNAQLETLESPTVAEACTPIEAWLVVDSQGRNPYPCKSPEHADAKRIVYDAEYPLCGPHRVAHVREVTA
jgi:hypothetical protein